jgi:flavodoxin
MIIEQPEGSVISLCAGQIYNTMKRALIVYQSKTGTTRQMSEEIRDFFIRNQIEARSQSVTESENSDLLASDYILFGCWTKGLLIFRQHPDSEWVDFIKGIPDLKGKRLGLFATYRVATGSLFGKMKKYLNGNSGDVLISLKSRNGHLSGHDVRELSSFINL